MDLELYQRSESIYLPWIETVPNLVLVVTLEQLFVSVDNTDSLVVKRNS